MLENPWDNLAAALLPVHICWLRADGTPFWISPEPSAKKARHASLWDTPWGNQQFGGLNQGWVQHAFQQAQAGAEAAAHDNNARQWAQNAAFLHGQQWVTWDIETTATHMNAQAAQREP